MDQGGDHCPFRHTVPNHVEGVAFFFVLVTPDTMSGHRTLLFVRYLKFRVIPEVGSECAIEVPAKLVPCISATDTQKGIGNDFIPDVELDGAHKRGPVLFGALIGAEDMTTGLASSSLLR